MSGNAATPSLFAQLDAPAPKPKPEPRPDLTSSQRSSQTSVEAAREAAYRAGDQMTRYITALCRAKEEGLTDHEAAEALGIQNTTVCARRGSITGKQFVWDSGKRRTGPFGTSNVVWVHKLFAGPDAKPQKGAERG